MIPRAIAPIMTLVHIESRIDECGLPRKSTDTSGSVTYSRMPFNGPSAAAFSAAFTSSVEVFFPRSAARSTSDTFGVGTRIDMFEHFGRLLMALLKFSTMTPARMMRRVEFEGDDRLRAAYAHRKGVLLFTGHFGFWEINALVHGLSLGSM